MKKNNKIVKKYEIISRGTLRHQILDQTEFR